MYRIIRVIDDNKNFLVLEVKDIITDETVITYVNREVDLGKDIFDKKDLMIL